MFKINLFGSGNTEEAKKESAKDMCREWQRKLKSEARDIDRSIRTIEREEDKIRKDIVKMAKSNPDPVNIKTLAKSLVRSGKAKGRLYNARSTMMTASTEIQSIAATMRLADSMQKSSEVMAQMNSLVNIPELNESMRAMSKEMFRAGLIDEMVGEAMDAMDDDDVEDMADAEVGKVLDDLAIDAQLRLAMNMPASTAPATAVAQPSDAVAAAIAAAEKEAAAS
mmetsp:Transcript_109256/g.189576  ORF Transcript_109256/g.189576 Transcript_109256/m.189576 type:complete len:224 (+) Transcript_109256:105-776(+)